MKKVDKKKIHKNSEIWNYDGQVEFTQELVDFFEDERKRVKREQQQNNRNLAFEDMDIVLQQLNINKKTSLEKKVENNILIQDIFKILKSCTSLEQSRFIKHRVFGFTLTDIAKCENVSKMAVLKSIKKVDKKLTYFKEIYKN